MSHQFVYNCQKKSIFKLYYYGLFNYAHGMTFLYKTWVSKSRILTMFKLIMAVKSMQMPVKYSNTRSNNFFSKLQKT